MNKKKRSLKYLVPCIIIVVIAIIISLVFVFSHTDTKEYDNKLEEAQKYVEEMDYEKAETTYLEAIKIDSKQPKAYLKLADVYVADGQADKAIKILNKGLKNIDKDGQKEISEKKKKIEKQTKNQNVINNGGNHVTYNGKTYYWKYTVDSLELLDQTAIYKGIYLQYLNDVENTLVCSTKNGKEEAVYEGIGHGKIWIYNQRIYSSRGDEWFSIKLDGTDEIVYDISDVYAVSNDGLIVGTKDFNISLLEKNGEIEVIKEGAAFCYFEGNKVYYEIRSEIGTNGNITNEILNFGSVDVNGNNDFILVNLSVKDWYGDDYDFDYPIRIPITIDCVQIINDEIYFQYGGYDGSSYIYQGGKIAKVKKDGTGFTNIKDIEMDSTTSFTVYKNGSDVEIKTGGALNKPFCEYENSSDYSLVSTTVNIYTNESSEKKEILSKNEYKSIGSYVDELEYIDNELYFVAVQVDESDSYVQSYTYCKKNLKTNKIEKIQEIIYHDF